MVKGTTKNLNAQNSNKLPLVVRHLIESDKQRRICGVSGGNFLGQLDKMVSYLRQKAACNSFSDAIGLSESELEHERFYALYRMLFPKE